MDLTTFTELIESTWGADEDTKRGRRKQIDEARELADFLEKNPHLREAMNSPLPNTDSLRPYTHPALED